MSRLAWRLLREGPLEVQSSLLLCQRAGSKYPSHSMCCYVKLLQADHGRGGILYIYPSKSSLGRYSVISFVNITVKEPWVGELSSQIELILDFEPVLLCASDQENRDEWIVAFRGIERMQCDHAAGNCPEGCLKTKPCRIPEDELQAVDLAIHRGEHICLPSPHKSNDECICNQTVLCNESCSGEIDSTAEIAPKSNKAKKKLIPDVPGECIILNNRRPLDIPLTPGRNPLVVIGELIHTIQFLYGITKEGQRMNCVDTNETDEWHSVADSQMFQHFVSSTSELKVVDISSLESHEKSKFFVSTYSLLSMHAAGALKLTLHEVMEDYTTRIAYIISNRVYSLAEIIELCS